MKKMLLLAALAIFALATFAYAADAPKEPINMKYVSKEVVFNHNTHEAIKCVDCHHLVDGKENYASCVSAGCHDDLEQKSKNKLSFYKIVHTDKEGCVGCHKKMATAENKKAMTSCTKSACHP